MYVYIYIYLIKMNTETKTHARMSIDRDKESCPIPSRKALHLAGPRSGTSQQAWSDTFGAEYFCKAQKTKEAAVYQNFLHTA